MDPSNVIPTLRYMAHTLKHKGYVFRAGLRTGARLVDLILHDISKFGPAEAPHYARRIFGKADDPEGFRQAWLHHHNGNRHHWEWWIPRTSHALDDKHPAPLPIPERVVREMVADWMGATRMHNDWPENVENWEWLRKNFGRLHLHPVTVERLDMVLMEVFGQGLSAIGVVVVRSSVTASVLGPVDDCVPTSDLQAA